MPKASYKVLDTFLLRSPLLPIECADATLPEKFSELFRTAVAVASPSLFNNAGEKAESKWYQYQKRMSSRPTPFGLFAGVALGHFGSKTDLSFSGNHRTRSRTDSTLIMNLVEELESDRTFRRKLRYRQNPEAFNAANRIWITPINSKNKTVSIRVTAAVTRILDLCQGTKTFAKVAAQIASEFQADRELVEDAFHQMCDLSILISELRMPLLTDDPLRDLLNNPTFRRHSDARTLEKIKAALSNWDNGITKSSVEYLRLVELLKTSRPTDTDGGNAIQVDSSLGLQGKMLSNKVAVEVSKAAELCIRLNTVKATRGLTKFAAAFRNRYQMGREIPILELLDETFGLGCPFPIRQSTPESLQKREQLLLSIASTALKDGVTAVELSETDLKTLETPQTQVALPSSLDLFVNILADSRQDIDAGNFKVAVAPRAGEIGAGRTLGRFADMFGEEANEFLRNIAVVEEAEDRSAIYADVSYWPAKSRAGNVSTVRGFRNYSIIARCYPNSSSNDIPLSEIVVGLDKDGRFCARWNQTGQKIIAKSNNMLNWASAPNAIRFLLEIAADDSPNVSEFNWGTAEKLPFLPRLTVGNLVLRSAQWDLKEISVISKNTPKAFFNHLQKWRTVWKVPSFVQMSFGKDDDRPLLLNLTLTEDCELLRSALARGSARTLREYLPCHNWHSTDDGHYMSEIVVSLVRIDLLKDAQKSESKLLQFQPVMPNTRSDYLRLPGSDWLYLRLNCGTSIQEAAIRECNSMANSLTDQGFLKEWFFVRYQDSAGDHLRVRFHTEVAYETLLSKILPWANQLASADVCSEFSVMTYDREVERYGGTLAMSLVEELFCIDSINACQLLSMPEIKSLDRRLACILSIDNLLSSLGISNEEKRELLKNAFPLGIKRSVSAEYRVWKNDLYAALTSPMKTCNTELKNIAHAIRFHSMSGIKRIGRELRKLEENGKLTQPLLSILSACIHMHCNRLLGIDRKAENETLALLSNSVEALIMRPCNTENQSSQSVAV